MAIPNKQTKNVQKNKQNNPTKCNNEKLCYVQQQNKRK
jgi:hypothetical protein